MAAVDAWALSEYGTDRYGTFLPVHLEAWTYGQMSALLSYCMVPFIKLFGLNTVAVRLPMLVVSSAGIALVYLVGKKLFNEKLALAAMLLTAVNPWQFMQSRWSLDCNLFPHIFLLAFYLLLVGLEKRPWLYVSMVFFGLTFYCYGVAAYSVTAFLFVFFLWCLCFCGCICLFVFVSLCKETGTTFFLLGRFRQRILIDKDEIRKGFCIYNICDFLFQLMLDLLCL